MSSASTLALFARLILSMAVVLGLMWAASVVLRRRGIAIGAGAKQKSPGVQVELLARRSMGRNVSIAVVRVADRAMVVGITDHQVTTLAETDLEEIDVTEQEAQRTVLSNGLGGPAAAGTTSTSGSAWKAMLEQVRERTVRH